MADDFEDLTQQLKQCATERDHLLREKQELRESLEELQRRFNSLNEENVTLFHQILETQTVKDLRKQRQINADLRHSRKHLRQMNEKLVQNIDRLENENIALHQELKRLQNILDSVQIQHEILTPDPLLQQKNEQLLHENALLQRENAQLQEINTTLKRQLEQANQLTLPATATQVCKCGCGRFFVVNKIGRKREFFSHACRSRYYRRKKSEEGTHYDGAVSERSTSP